MPGAGSEIWWTLIIGTSTLLTLGIVFIATIVLSQRRFITVERRNLEALRQREQRFRSLIDNSFDAIALVNGEGKIVYASQSTSRVLGYTPEEFANVRVHDLLDSADIDELQRLHVIHGQTADARVMLQFRVRHKDGSWRWLEGVATNLINEPEVNAVVLNYRDITDKKLAEEKRRESEERFRKGFENGPVGVIFVGLDKEIMKANHAFCEMLGYAEEEIVGKTFLEITHPDDVEMDARLADKVLRGEIPHFTIEKRFVGKNGGTVWIYLTATAVKDAEGNVLYGLEMAENITDRKKAEEALRGSYQQLRALSSRLQSIREDERTRIAREIHDELGQMLTVLKMDLALLERKLPHNGGDVPSNGTPAEIEAMSTMIDSIIQSVRRIATELRPEVLDELGLKEAIEWEMETFEIRTGITSSFTTNVSDVSLNRDHSTALFRIFQETLTNIARHAHASEVSARLEEHDNTLILEVRDNGRGITDRELNGASSLGLLGMRERALLMGGEVAVKGEPGSGTTVHVKVPLR